MAKKNRRTDRPGARPADSTRPGAKPASTPPQPPKPKRQAVPFVARPFEGLPGEHDWIAMREVVPAATAQVRTTAEHGSRDVTIVSLLPDLLPAMRRQDGVVLVALQTVGTSGDASRDVADALLQALDLEPGGGLGSIDLPEAGPRLQDVLDLSQPFEVSVHDTFDYWVSDEEKADKEVAEALESANEMIVPTAAVAVPEGLGAAYWCRMNGKEFLRWSVPGSEEETLDALARLQAARTAALDDGARLIGAFRTGGVLVPVWELARGTEADELPDAVAALGGRLRDALDTTDPLSSDQRRARAGLVSRQVNLR
ncbi:DUF5926 family protein [Litorihabitans aurantiacus]|uniref:DUF5926 domain-containing protein n=1 Tax=Litorihabitans aurantiacus TaxID=1930061 RepID=A0AA37XH27_9MICO|nr:DUF5926 family protein [Litorihabitans aurantiacus]GMA33406.1 hypothetical protein GCM10025875_33980 [Litorihabitans aurantiacus]